MVQNAYAERRKIAAGNMIDNARQKKEECIPAPIDGGIVLVPWRRVFVYMLQSTFLHYGITLCPYN